MYDVTAWRTAKCEPVGFFRWVLPRLDPALTFAGWSCSCANSPHGPHTELTCDALAEFVAAARPEEPWMIVAEFQTEPRSDDLEARYRIRDGAFVANGGHSSDPRLKYMVGAVLLNLTGPQQPDHLTMPMPGMSELGLGGRIMRPVREEDAAATLARIASGDLSRCVLPWVTLMKGSGTPATIEEWKRLADLEKNPPLRLEYGADALVFAELADVPTGMETSPGGMERARITTSSRMASRGRSQDSPRDCAAPAGEALQGDGPVRPERNNPDDGGHEPLASLVRCGSRCEFI